MRITIRADDSETLDLLVNQDVKVSLKSDAFTQDCVEGEEPLDTSLDFPVSAPSCNSCGGHHWDL